MILILCDHEQVYDINKNFLYKKKNFLASAIRPCFSIQDLELESLLSVILERVADHQSYIWWRQNKIPNDNNSNGLK